MYYPQFYDPQFNLLYVFVAPLGEEKKSILSRMSSSSSSDTGYTNVVLWDIPKKAKKNLFSSQELSKDEHITAILFETGYNAEKNERIFNDNAYVFKITGESRTSLASSAPRVNNQPRSSNEMSVCAASPTKPARNTRSPPDRPAFSATEPTTGLPRTGAACCTPTQLTRA